MTFLNSAHSTPLHPPQEVLSIIDNQTKIAVVKNNNQGGYYKKGKSFSRAKWSQIIVYYQAELDLAVKCTIDRFGKDFLSQGDGRDKRVLCIESDWTEGQTRTSVGCEQSYDANCTKLRPRRNILSKHQLLRNMRGCYIAEGILTTSRV